MSVVFLKDAYTDKPRSKRGQLEERIRHLKMRRWGDPGDRELHQQIAELEDELVTLDDYTENRFSPERGADDGDAA